MKGTMLLMRFVLAMVALAMDCALVYGLFVFKPTDLARDLLVGAVGSITTLATISFNFFFTASLSGQSQQDTIAKQSEMLAASQPMGAPKP